MFEEIQHIADARMVKTNRLSVCQICGANFEPYISKPTQKYCSPKCQTRAAYAKALANPTQRTLGNKH